MNILVRSIKDFLTLRFLLLSTLPFLASFFIFGAIFLYGGSEFINFLNSTGDGNFANIDPQIHPIINYILTLALVKWVIVTFFYLFGTILILLISIIIGVIIVGFFTPYIVKIIHKQYYQNYIRDEISFTKVIIMYIKVFFIFIFLSFVAIPLLLVPGVNLLIFNIPFYYLFHNLLVIDVGSNIENLQRFKLLTQKYKKEFISATFISYMLSLIPIIGLFLQPLFVIFLTHLFFEKSIKAGVNGGA